MRNVVTKGVVLVFSLALVVAACGDDDAATTTAPATTTTAATTTSGGGAAVEPSIYCTGDCLEALALQADPASIDCTVGLSWNTAGHPYGATSISRTEELAATLFPNMTLYTGHGQGDAAIQTAQIEDLLTRGIDVLIVSPADAGALADVVDRAKAAGVLVIASDRAVDTEVLTYIGAENVDTGQVAGEYVAELLGGEGKVAVLQGSLGASPTIDRQRGFLETLADYPGIEVIADQSANYNRADGLRVMEDYLQRFGPGEIDAVFTHNDEMSLGAIQAIKEAGRLDEILVIGIDGQESALDAIEAGEYAGSVVYPITAREHLIAAAKACAGEPLPARIYLTAILATIENLAQIRGTTF